MRHDATGARRRDVRVREGDQSAKEKKKTEKKDKRLTAASRLPERHSVCRFKKRGDPPAFVNERGSQCTYEGKGAISGEKEERKNTNQVVGKGAARADSRKKGTPSRLQT